jgi:CoA:oxalate CoA-transferase
MEKRFDRVVAETKVKPLLERWFSNYTKSELEEMAGDKIPLSAIKTIAEVVEDPHIAARNMIVKVPIAGKLIGMFGQPIKLSGAAQPSFEKAPAPGEHNAEVLSGLAGVSAAELERLKASGVI